MDQVKNRYWERTQALVGRVLALLVNRDFAVRLADGTHFPPPSGGRPTFTLHLKRPSALYNMLVPPNVLGFGESYLFDDFDVEGDMVAAFGALETLDFHRPSWGRLLSLWRELRYLARGAHQMRPAAGGDFAAYEPEGALYSTRRDIESAQFAYDVSNDFYRLWLDERMVYSCAIFEHEGQSLDAAQLNKLQTVGQSLDLQPGERLLDVGCGWGGLIIHAVTEFGADATGITLSQAQVDEASARIDRAGIGDRCRAILSHYEEMVAQPFDKLSSVGMFEHVGPSRLAGYFRRAHALLKAGGLFYLQGGVRRHAQRQHSRRFAWPGKDLQAFTQKYAFPDSHLSTLDELLRAAEENGFEALWYRSLRPHYPLTLRHWLDRLEDNHARAAAYIGESGYRAWRVMLAGYLYLLHAGQLSEAQCLLRRT